MEFWFSDGIFRAVHRDVPFFDVERLHFDIQSKLEKFRDLPSGDVGIFEHVWDASRVEETRTRARAVYLFREGRYVIIREIYDWYIFVHYYYCVVQK